MEVTLDRTRGTGGGQVWGRKSKKSPGSKSGRGGLFVLFLFCFVFVAKSRRGVARDVGVKSPGSWEPGREVTNRWDGEAESQWIVAARLLYHLQYLVPYLSRLQRIHLPDRLEL
jgi:hypothetical protein